MINQRNEKNPNWKGDKAGKSAIHYWVISNLGIPRECEICRTKIAKVFDWSNKNHLYKRNLKDWQRLCRPCHRKYDYDNQLSFPKKSTNTTSIYRGVTWDKQMKSWKAQLFINNKNKNLGLFDTEHHAAMVRDIWAKELFGKTFRLNFPNAIFYDRR